MGKEQNIIKMEISNMKVIILMIKEKEMVNIHLEMALIIQVNLKMTYPMEKEFNTIQMEINYMKVILLMGKEKAMVNLYMKTIGIIQVN